MVNSGLAGAVTVFRFTDEALEAQKGEAFNLGGQPFLHLPPPNGTSFCLAGNVSERGSGWV